MAQQPEWLDAWRALLNAHAATIAVLGKQMQDQLGLPITWYEVLLMLHESPESHLRMHEIAKGRILSRSATTRLVDRVEKAGYVTRDECDDDRRGTFVQMTDSGADIFQKAGRLHLAGIREHFGDLISDQESEMISEVMWRVARKLQP